MTVWKLVESPDCSAVCRAARIDDLIWLRKLAEEVVSPDELVSSVVIELVAVSEAIVVADDCPLCSADICWSHRDAFDHALRPPTPLMGFPLFGEN